MHARIRLLPFLVIPGVLSLLLAASAAPPSGEKVEVVKTPNGGIQPQAVAGADGTLHLLYFTGDPKAGDLFYVRRAPGQAGWSAPLRVNSQPGGAVAIGTIRGGQLALGKGPKGIQRAHVVWFGSDRAGERGAPLYYSRLNDAGKAFEPQRNLMQVSSTLDGGPSVAADGVGNVYAAWHAAETKAAGETARRLWVAHSSDEGKTFGREVPSNPDPTGACACCSVKAFADSRGTLYILYRSAVEKVDRDIYLLTSKDHAKTFKSQRLDRWKINACPMSSEALAESGDGILAAWETNGQVSYAAIDPASMKVSAPVAPLGSGGRKHPAVARNAGGETLFAWTEGTGWQRGGAVGWQLFDRQGRPTATKGRLEAGVPAWGLVSVVARPDGGFVVLH